MKWFKHDADMHQNRKLRKLVRTHGATGYAFWCVLLEKIYFAEGDFQISADELWFEDIAEDLKLGDYRTPIRILDTLSDLGLISSQLWQDHVIAIPSVIERGDQYLIKRASEAEKKRGQRAKKAQLSPRDKEGTKGQTDKMSPSEIRSRIQIQNSDPDLNPLKDSKDSCVVREASASAPPVIAEAEVEEFLKEIGQIEIEHLRAELIEAEAKEPELASLLKPNPITQESKPKRRSATRRRVKAAAPESQPDAFEQWWKAYYEFCLKVNVSPGDRASAATTWDILHGIEANCTARILEGCEWYRRIKEGEFAAKGEAIGIAHGCRFLSKRKWQEALDHKALKPSFFKESEPINLRGKSESPGPELDPDWQISELQQLNALKERSGEKPALLKLIDHKIYLLNENPSEYRKQYA